ncbi:hypothetical protein G5B46_08980 [Caulobacter sp. 602-2]|uniref:Uncharacterized protein n=1 Tax=Caulobacter sp. 602-2 TaxID=2710887 RepID=A0A6G4QWW7_9CAUL|nr:hypothetical protein [Caulobacter sp. 602-2]NGM49735.1 hypothetical protein [Caulobacter sp. 602-2]
MDFSDERWVGLMGGYRVVYDPRPALRAIDEGRDVEAAWSELWEELHHQGDVDLASYAVAPHLARLAATGKAGGWNAYGLAATIQQSRRHERNPAIPDWLELHYTRAWTALFASALDALRTADDPDVVGSLLAVVAIHRGMPILGDMALEFSEAERLEILIEAGWEAAPG